MVFLSGGEATELPMLDDFTFDDRINESVTNMLESDLCVLVQVQILFLKVNLIFIPKSVSRLWHTQCIHNNMYTRFSIRDVKCVHV